MMKLQKCLSARVFWHARPGRWGTNTADQRVLRHRGTAKHWDSDSLRTCPWGVANTGPGAEPTATSSEVADVTPKPTGS